MKQRMVLIAALVVIVAGLAFWITVRDNDSRQVAEMFGGKRSLEVVADHARVEAYRLGPLPESIDWQSASISDYPKTVGPVRVPEAIAGQIAQALLSPGTYDWDAAKGCTPSYGVRISFARGDDRIDVLFCFECDVLLVGCNGRITGGENFDHARPLLVQAVKAIFPADEVIQRLREKRLG